MASSSVVTIDSFPSSSKAAGGMLPAAVPEDRLSGAAVVSRKPGYDAQWGIDDPSSPMRDEHRDQFIDESRLTESYDSRTSRLPIVPETSTLFTDPYSAISAASNDLNRNLFRQDVSGFVNNTASVPLPSPAPRYSVHPSRLLETDVSSFYSPNHHGLKRNDNRLRTSNQVFETGEELALHYGIPTLLPPPPQTTHKTLEKQQQPPSPAFDFETLRSNYISMINEKPTDNTMAVDPVPMPTDFLPSSHLQHPELEDWMISMTCTYAVLGSSGHVIDSAPLLASPQFQEFLTSPVLHTPAQDFESSPNETPYSDFLSTPLLDTLGDELFNSPGLESDLPLFAADERFTSAPSSIKTKTAELPELPGDLYEMPPIPETEVINPAWVYCSPPATRPSLSITGPSRDPSPTPQSTVATGRRRIAATGTRKNINPEKLIPIDAPTQPRHYTTPSATSRKEIPAVFLKKRQRAEMGDEEDELLEPLPPNATEREQIEYKRRQNTLAARKSRKRKLMHQQELEAKVDKLQNEVTTWQTRCDVLSKLLQNHGIRPPTFND